MPAIGSGEGPEGRGRQIGRSNDPAVILAKAILAELQEAPNQPTNGRFSKAAIARVDDFLANDQVYADLASRYLGEGALNGEVVAVCDQYIRNYLLNFERIASRNPELQVLERLGDALPVAYRYWAALAFSFERKRIDLNPEKFLLPQDKPSTEVVAPTAPKEIAALQAPNSSLPEGAASFSSAVEQARQQVVEASPVEEVLFERLCQYVTGKMGSIAEQVRLYGEIHNIGPGTISETLHEMIRSDIFGEGKFGKELAELAELGKDCSEFSKEPGAASVFGCAALLSRIYETRQYWGLATVPDPVVAFVEDGFLTTASAAILIDSQKALEVAPKVALSLAKDLSKTSTVTNSLLKDLSELVNIMHFAGKDDAYIEATLKRSLQHHQVGRLAHLHNCAALMSQGVDVEGLFLISPEAENVVARAVSEEFSHLPRTHPRFGTLVRESIDSQLRVIRETSPEERSIIQSTLKLLAEDGNPQLNELTLSVLATAKLLGADASGARLLQLGQAYASVAKSGASLKEVEWMLSNIPEGIEPAAVFAFFENLASLQRSGVVGVSNLFANCRKVWQAQVAHNQTQNISGFFIEAQTALNLQKNGYRLISVSSKHGGGVSGVEYDLIASSPEGQMQAIEIKRSLETLVGKNDAVWNATTIQDTQLYRLVAAAQKDNLAPVIAVMYTGRNSWAAGPVGHMLSAVKDLVGVKPAVMSAETGQKILV